MRGSNYPTLEKMAVMPRSSAPPVLSRWRSALDKDNPERHSKGAVALRNPHSRLPVLIKKMEYALFLLWAQKSGLRQSLHQIHNSCSQSFIHSSFTSFY